MLLCSSPLFIWLLLCRLLPSGCAYAVFDAIYVIGVFAAVVEIWQLVVVVVLDCIGIAVV